MIVSIFTSSTDKLNKYVISDDIVKIKTIVWPYIKIYLLLSIFMARFLNKSELKYNVVEINYFR